MRTNNTIVRSLSLLGLVAIATACNEPTKPVSSVVPLSPSLAKGGPGALPTNGRIYFTSDFAGNFDVYSMKSDGTDRRRLSLTPDTEGYLNVSRDGKKLVVGSGNGSGSELVTMNADGTNRRVLMRVDGSVTIAFPAFSPDGRSIAFTSNIDLGQSSYSIWTVSASGGKATRLTPTTHTAAYAAWSPDGQQIVYSRGPLGTNGEDLYIMNADGSNSTLLYDCATECKNAAWSADGSQIVYIENTGVSSKLASCTLRTTTPTCDLPVPHTALPIALALSPDGSQIATASFDLNALGIVITTSNINGTGQVGLTPALATITSVAWGR